MSSKVHHDHSPMLHLIRDSPKIGTGILGLGQAAKTKYMHNTANEFTQNSNDCNFGSPRTPPERY